MPQTQLSAALLHAAQRRASYREQPIQTTHLRTAAALVLNIEHAIEVFGVSSIGFMTLTFKHYLTPLQAVKRVRKLVRKFTALFPSWVWVMELKPGCRPHFHFLVATRHNLSAGFDDDAYDTLKALSAQAQAEGREFTPHESQFANSLKRTLKTNPALKNLHRDFRRLLSSSRMGFGYHFELTPIRKSPAAVAAYFRKNYLNAVVARHGHSPGVHLTASSRSFPKVLWSNFTLTTNTARFDYQAIGEALGLADMDAMKSRFGPQWPSQLAPVIDDLRFHFSQNPSLWPARAIREAARDYLP